MKMKLLIVILCLFYHTLSQYNMGAYLTCWEQNKESPTGFKDPAWTNSTSEQCRNFPDLCSNYQTQGANPGNGDVCQHNIQNNVPNMCYFNVIFLAQIDAEKSWTFKCWHDSLCPLKDANGVGITGCLVTSKRISCCCNEIDFCNGQELFTRYAAWGRPDHFPPNFTEINTYQHLFPLIQTVSTSTPLPTITTNPTHLPTTNPVRTPTIFPSISPTANPIPSPTNNPTVSPTAYPTLSPSNIPSIHPSFSPTLFPSNFPTLTPSNNPSKLPTNYPTFFPSDFPSVSPTKSPTFAPTNLPTFLPTKSPTNYPSFSPTYNPSLSPTHFPSHSPTFNPSQSPTNNPTLSPTYFPSISPSYFPSFSPSANPSQFPSISPSNIPSHSPSNNPSTPPMITTQIEIGGESDHSLLNVNGSDTTTMSIVYGLVGGGMLGLLIGIGVLFGRKQCRHKRKIHSQSKKGKEKYANVPHNEQMEERIEVGGNKKGKEIKENVHVPIIDERYEKVDIVIDESESEINDE